MQQKKYEELVLCCVERWGEQQDDRIDNFCKQFHNWIAQISEDSKSIIIELLNKFCYYSHSETNKLLMKLHNRLISEYIISDDDTIYTMIKSKSGIGNSSNDYWVEYKSINNLNKYICYDNINKITKEQWQYIKNIVFIDDCCGTGKTFVEYIKSNIEMFAGKIIFFLAIHMMKDAIDKVKMYADKEKLEIHVINEVVQNKAFSEWIFTDDIKNIKKTFFKTSELLSIPKKEVFGFEMSESLMAFYNNTPNNTLGIFRYDTEKYKSIFPRKNYKRPLWQQMRELKEIRKKQNYNAIVRSNVDEV